MLRHPGAAPLPEGPTTGNGSLPRTIAAPHQSSDVGGMVGMQMSDAEHRQVGQLRPALPETKKASSAQVNQEFRLRANPQEIAGGERIQD